MDKFERIVGQEYTLAAHNFPGGRTRLSNQEWMDTFPVYEVAKETRRARGRATAP